MTGYTVVVVVVVLVLVLVVVVVVVDTFMAASSFFRRRIQLQLGRPFGKNCVKSWLGQPPAIGPQK